MMKMRTLVISLAALLVVLVTLVACGSESAAAPAQIMQDSANDDNLREDLRLEKGFGLTSCSGKSICDPKRLLHLRLPLPLHLHVSLRQHRWRRAKRLVAVEKEVRRRV